MKLIVAMDKNGGIGYNGQLPWNCPEDMKHFRETTVGNTVVMGYKTYLSLKKKPLKNRCCVVYDPYPSSDQYSTEDFIFTDNIKSIQMGAQISKNFRKETYVIGGAKIYNIFMAYRIIDELIVTHINEEHMCDTFFHVPENWTVNSEKVLSERATVKYYSKRS